MTHILRIDEMFGGSSNANKTFRTAVDKLWDDAKYPCLTRGDVAEIMKDCGLVLTNSQDGNYPFDCYNIEGDKQSEGIYIFFDKKFGFIKTVEPPFRDSRFGY